MTEQRPHIIIIGGPNGAGKSTTAPALLKGTLGVTEFVNADTIAQGLSAFHYGGCRFATWTHDLVEQQRIAIYIILNNINREGSSCKLEPAWGSTKIYFIK